MTNQLTRAEVYDHLARLEREGHPRPWEAFEAQGSLKNRVVADGLYTLIMWMYKDWPIRLKPQLPPMVERTIWYPEPVREALNYEQLYWIADPVNENYCHGEIAWHGDGEDYTWLHRGRIHLTERNAKAHGMAEAGCEWEEIEKVLRGEERRGEERRGEERRGEE